MWKAVCSIFLLGLSALSYQSFGQEIPNIIDQKDYNQSFYIKVRASSGGINWNNIFPDTWQDTSNTIVNPGGQVLKFKEGGTEKSIGFSALFGLRWGKLGGGFESSRADIDSLTETVDGQTYKLSYADSNQRIGFNKFYLDFETNPLFLTSQGDLALITGLQAGTIVLYPVSPSVNLSASWFFTISPQLEVRTEEWFYINLGLFYEYRYFNQKEDFLGTKWVFSNHLHAYGIHLSLKFRLYQNKDQRVEPPKNRIN